MTSPIFPYAEAIDLALQPVAHQPLHWLHLDEHTCELRRLIIKPQLDGFDKTLTQILGVIRYDTLTEQYLGFIHYESDHYGPDPDVLMATSLQRSESQQQLIASLHKFHRF
ncbi:hypothetical protein [Fibrella forsythiae]|uniref:Uncharacterized protein n=1 Tax=Fibrella forsythiae TaxID=2817061 RepID=A0ABS3JS28_9BACT|nr:hypothetical protein [Fibrella forsythiae]MBO0952830.1 hypothetical protein [Fibrella forsythiae]